MAPMLLDSDREDDFVRTISDDDPDYPVEEEEAEEDPTAKAPTRNTQNGKKRKRGTDENDGTGQPSVHGGNGLPKHKNKKGPKSDRKSAESDAGTEGEDQHWTAGGEDDGTMDSDFEFQIGDVDNGVVEGFDSWITNGTSATLEPAKGGSKKGVDIDELIARRRNSQKFENAEKVTNGDINELSEEDGDGDIGEDDSEDPDLDIDAEDDDETLAEDAFGMGAEESDEDDQGDDNQDKSTPESEPESDEESIAEPVAHPNDLETDASSVDEQDDTEERTKREAFFAPEEKESKSKTKSSASGSFQTMSLSRPILRGLAAVGFTSPTPIQNKTIPVALLGKDVVGGAVTGSGKTAAFIIPILERLLYRPKKVPTSRVAILMPTRELAVQCFAVSKKLAQFTDITFCQLVGGFSLREQETILRQRPDIIIATPGRFIDHMRNSASFTLDALEILVLDEADRMLEDGFADELNEILTTIPKSRQTMLFSATMTSRVDNLIRVGLNRPVRLMVDARAKTVTTLTQEFVRLRPGREDKRLGYLLHLVQTIYTERTIIFLRQKKEAHRIRIIFGLLGIKAAELHGSMSQEQRISALHSFRTSQTTHLLATDLASRGLDIPNINIVINYTAPQSHSIYLHRVGRTARAGRLGRSCTLAAEPDRKVVKQAVKSAKAQGAKIVSRVVDPGDADHWAAKAADLEREVEDVLREEKEEKLLSGAEMQIRKSENLMEHEDEIKSRPKRTWFESERDKVVARKKGAEELNGAVGLGRGKGSAKGKLSNKDKKRLDDGRERGEGRVWKKGRGDGVAAIENKNKERKNAKGKDKKDRKAGNGKVMKSGIGKSKGAGAAKKIKAGGRR